MVVVGAGLAGLTAARDLIRAGSSVAVLEARDRVGGRTLNEPLGDGKVVEVGGQWLGPTQHRMAALARSVGVDTFPTHTSGENLSEFGGRKVRHRGSIPRLSPHILLDFGRAQLKLDGMARRVPVEAPWAADRAEEWDSQTFASWVRANCLTGSGRRMFEVMTEAVWSAQPGELSLLHVLFYIHSAGGVDSLIDTEGGAQQDRFVGGSQLVSERLADQLGDVVRLGSPVRRIEHGADSVAVAFDGAEVSARRVIVAIPPTLTARIAYDPPLPGYRDQLTQRMPQGTVSKCMAVYERPFWRDDGLSGIVTSGVGPVKIAYDNSPPDGSPGVLLGFLEGQVGRDLGLASAEERRAAVVDCFERFFGPRAASPERYIERSWAEEEWSRGCYGCYFGPGGWTSFGPALREPIGPIHWAGSETATVWAGYMDGAVQSGERAAREVLTSLTPGAGAKSPPAAARPRPAARAAPPRGPATVGR